MGRFARWDGLAIPSANLTFRALASNGLGNPPFNYSATLGSAGNANDFLLVMSGAAATGPGCTVGGLACSQLLNVSSGNLIAWLLSPANLATLGSTATIRVTGSGSGDQGGGIAVWRLHNANPVPTNQPTDQDIGSTTGSAAAINMSIAPDANEIVLGAAFAFGAGVGPAVTFTWSGVTEAYDQGNTEQTDYQSGGSLLTTVGGTAAVRVTPSKSTSMRALCLAFQGHA